MKRRCQVLSLLILVLPVGVVGLLWHDLPEHLPMHFTVEGQPDRYGSRREWLGMLVSTTLFLALLPGLFLRFLPNRLLIHHRLTGALYLISAAFIASLIGVIILKTVLNSSLFPGLVMVLSSPNSRWPIAILANLLAFLVLTVIGSHMYRKAN